MTSASMVQLLGCAAFAALLRARSQKPGIEQLDIGLEHRQVAEFESVLDHSHQAAKARRVLVQALEALGVLGDRLADAADRVGEKAELLQDGVVRDRAQLARMLEVDLARPVVVLALAPAASRSGTEGWLP